MFNRCYLFLSILLMSVLFAAVAAFAQTYYPPEPPAGYGPPPGYRPGYPGYHAGRRIVRAIYGTRGRYADVTGIVRRFARDGIPFEVSNETFGVDPYKGEGKHLRVTMVRPDGVQFERSWDEGDRVRL